MCALCDSSHTKLKAIYLVRFKDMDAKRCLKIVTTRIRTQKQGAYSLLAPQIFPRTFNIVNPRALGRHKTPVIYRSYYSAQWVLQGSDVYGSNVSFCRLFASREPRLRINAARLAKIIPLPILHNSFLGREPPTSYAYVLE